MTMRLLVLLVILLCCSVMGESEGPLVEIPLDQIWALDMPGTKNAQKLAADDSAKIRRVLVNRAAERVKVGPCFLVTGEGKEATSNAAKVIVDGKSPAKTLPADKDLSLVFYSFFAPGYVHIQSVHRSGSKVAVIYQVVTHRTLSATVHFAVIPLGKLPAGKVTIETIELPSVTPYAKQELTERAVCDSCEFTIQHGGAER